MDNYGNLSRISPVFTKILRYKSCSMKVSKDHDLKGDVFDHVDM